MDFEISLGYEGDRIDGSCVMEQYDDVLRLLHDRLAYWNNIDPHKVLYIRIRKVPSQTETIGIVTNDQPKASERIS